MLAVKERQQMLDSWLRDTLGQAPCSVIPLAGDASFRRYFRVTTEQKTYVLMDAPPEKEPMQPFLTTAQKLHKAKVNVPFVYAYDLALGVSLLTDFGDSVLLQVVDEDNFISLYQQAIDNIIAIQNQIPTDDLPDFNQSHIETELNLFSDWFLGAHLNFKHKAAELASVYQFLIEEIVSQPKVAIHRDFHSRNLMVTADNRLGVIDFQDMMKGPIGYDLASLLRDCYICFSGDQIDFMLAYYAKSKYIENQFDLVRAFDLAGVQRHLKAIGIFCRLNYRDGKANYLKEIDLPLKYLDVIADKYSRLKPLKKLLGEIT